MNCRNVEELLPQYVGRDLEQKRARQVTAHVQTCSECARSAHEYGEAHQLLQLFEPPEFSEATYAEVRSLVLREIELQSVAPLSIFALEFFRRPFQSRMLWAVSTVVLLAVCLFAFYFLGNLTSGPQNAANMAVNRGAGGQKTPGERTSAGTQNDNSVKDLKAAPNGTAGTPPATASKSSRSQLNLKAQTAWLSRKAGGAPALPAKTAQNSLEAKGTDTSATAEKPLRLEIQTNDRNIRIIWFTHSSTKEGSPTESSKGI